MHVFVADTNGNRIEKLSPGGEILAQWGSKGSGPGQFLRPQGITLDPQGNVYVADTYNHRIQKFSPSGKFLHQWGTSGIGSGQFLFPRGIVVDAHGTMYVADVDNRVQKLSSAEMFWQSGRISGPPGVSVIQRAWRSRRAATFW